VGRRSTHPSHHSCFNDKPISTPTSSKSNLIKNALDELRKKKNISLTNNTFLSTPNFL
jgi:hypothetical protein